MSQGRKAAQGKAPKTTQTARVLKLSRNERNDIVKRRLFNAAAGIVGEMGYAEASVARITARAGVAQGTFYTHFPNRQDLLDRLLPEMGQDMLAFIKARIDTNADARRQEEQRFRAFFDYLDVQPGFLRILNEAEIFAPEGHRRHIDNIARNYVRLFRRGRSGGKIGDFTDAELEVVAHIFMGARGYLGQRYAADGAGGVPAHVMSAYSKLIRGLLFRSGDKTGGDA